MAFFLCQYYQRICTCRSLMLAGTVSVLALWHFPAYGHGYMTFPPSRAMEQMPGDEKGWPIAGIKARFRREPCVGLAPNAVFTPIKTGYLELEFLYPDGANHTGSCSAFLFDPLRPDQKTLVGEISDCARSDHPAAGRKGEDIPGHMSVFIPEEVPCDPSHCVLQWVWTATHKSTRNPELFEHYDNCGDVTIVGARKALTTQRASLISTGSGAGLSPDIPIALGYVNTMLGFAGVQGGHDNTQQIREMQQRIEALSLHGAPAADARSGAHAANIAGIDFLRAGRVVEAIQSFQLAYHLNPTDAEIVNNLGFAYWRGGDVEAAVPWLRLSLVYEPARTNAWANLGQALATSGKVSEAVAALSLAYRYSQNPGATRRFLEKMAADENGNLGDAATQTLRSELVDNGQ